MKALTVLQPWATLLAVGAKRVETRRWRTAYRGPLLIHAGRGTRAARDLARREPFCSALQRHGHEPGSLALGVLLGCVQLVDCVPAEAVHDGLSPVELAFGDYRPGTWAWLLGGAVQLAVPLPYRGALGLFDVADELLGASLTDTERRTLQSGFRAAAPALESALP